MLLLIAVIERAQGCHVCRSGAGYGTEIQVFGLRNRIPQYETAESEAALNPRSKRSQSLIRKIILFGTAWEPPEKQNKSITLHGDTRGAEDISQATEGATPNQVMLQLP
jgi:hypothetical protein